jgi:hypothetical protein
VLHRRQARLVKFWEAAMNIDGKIETGVTDEFDHSFDVPLSPAEAWPVLSDVRRVTPSIPGAVRTVSVHARSRCASPDRRYRQLVQHPEL